MRVHGVQLPTHFPLAPHSFRNTAQALAEGRAGEQKAETHCSSKFHSSIFTGKYFKICFNLLLNILSYPSPGSNEYLVLQGLSPYPYVTVSSLFSGFVGIAQNLFHSPERHLHWGKSSEMYLGLQLISNNDKTVLKGVTLPQSQGLVGHWGALPRTGNAPGLCLCGAGWPAPSPALCQGSPLCSWASTQHPKAREPWISNEGLACAHDWWSDGCWWGGWCTGCSAWPRCPLSGHSFLLVTRMAS